MANTQRVWFILTAAPWREPAIKYATIVNDERGAVAVYSTGLRRGLGISAATSEREALELRIALCRKMASNG